jgi:predicted nucleotidyltransferase component of viral defense system
MFKYTRGEVVKIARENDFIVNNTEKVLRLSAILNYFATTTYGKYLSLKGGTAINLFMLDLPRLSVDIDFDFSCDCSKEEMISLREVIKQDISTYMQDEGYALSDKSKFVHTLDSFVFSYNTVSNSKDVLKIEINYSDRIHVLPIINDSRLLKSGEEVGVNRLSDLELMGSKISALISRTTPRDLYDVYNLFKKGNDDLMLIKKIAIFYVVLGSDTPVNFETILNNCITTIESVNYNKLRETLIPVLHKAEKLDIEGMKSFVLITLKELFILNDKERKFIRDFNSGIFEQELLFDDLITIDLKKHPMIIWKMKTM